MPSWLTLKLGGMIAGAVAILAFVVLAFHWKSAMTERGKQLDTICSATRTASNHPKLACGDVPQQIQFLGEAVTALSNSLKVQNAAVASLGEQTKQQQAAAQQASKDAQERAGKAQATSMRLDASSRAPQTKPCEPSKALKEAWR